MDRKIDSTAWTGDTSHRAATFTPEARAQISGMLKIIAGVVSALFIVAVIAKEVM